jgi:hypothetical protein
MAEHGASKAAKRAVVSQKKAKAILEHGEVHGKRLSARQKRFFGLIAGGGKPTRA